MTQHEGFKAQVVDIAKKLLAYTPDQETNLNHFENGCLFAMEDKDAFELNLEGTGIIHCTPPNAASTLKLLDVFIEENEREDVENPKEYVESFEDCLNNLSFFSFQGTPTFNTIEDVLTEVRKHSFWMPIFVNINGKWFSTYGATTTDENGNVVGVRL